MFDNLDRLITINT